MDRAQQFIQLFNRLSHYLNEQNNSSNNLPFYQLLKTVSLNHSVVRRYIVDLREYADLRNVIVHNQEYPYQLIAEPTENTIAHFTKIVDSITAPKKLIPTFSKQLQVFTENSPLAEAIDYMNFKEYSQVVVRTNDGLALLSIQSITIWFAEQLQAHMSIENVKVADALAHEDAGNVLFMARDAFVDDAREAFTAGLLHDYPHLQAIVITHSGSKDEAPLGIVTPWDFLRTADFGS